MEEKFFFGHIISRYARQKKILTLVLSEKKILNETRNHNPPQPLFKLNGRSLRPIWNICVTNDHGYVPLVVNTPRSFPRSWLISWFVTRLTRRVSLVEQKLLTLPEHLSSPPVFSGVRVTRSLVLYVCFVDRCLSLKLYFFFCPLCCLFFFDIRIMIAP